MKKRIIIAFIFALSLGANVFAQADEFNSGKAKGLEGVQQKRLGYF